MSIANKKDTRDLSHDNVFGFGSILNGKMLNINMMRMFSGDTVIDHIDSRHVVFIKWSGTILQVSNFGRTAQTYSACFAAVTAARNSDLVLEIAVVD